MDKTISDIAQYTQKLASTTENLRKMFSRLESYMDRGNRVKQASISAAKERAARFATMLSTTRLSTGDAFIEGYDQIKAAEMWLSDPEKVYDVLEMVINSAKAAAEKTASLSVGKPIDSFGKTAVSPKSQLADNSYDEFIFDQLAQG